MKHMLIKAKISSNSGSKSYTFYCYVFSKGYYGNEVNAIIVFAACFLPDSNREDYHDIMENLFL